MRSTLFRRCIVTVGTWDRSAVGGYQPIHSRVRQARPAKGTISTKTTNISVMGCLVTEGRGAMRDHPCWRLIWAEDSFGNASDNAMTVT